MKSLNYILITATLIIFQANTLFAQTYPTSGSTGSNNKCKTCFVFNALDAIDNNILSNYSTIYILSNAKGASVYQGFNFSTPSTSRSTFQIVVENVWYYTLDATVLGGVSIETFKNGISNNDTKSINDMTISSVSGSSTKHLLSVEVAANYDEVKFSLTNNKNGELSFIHVYEAYYVPVVSLPVRLISFTGTANNNTTVLNWATASEKNNHAFIIERSTDGDQYQEIGTVEGNGTTTATTAYTFSDKKVGAGTSYYRLKQIDFDGNINFSEVIEVVQNSEVLIGLTTTSNPFTTSLGVNFQSSVEGTVTIQLLDREGRTVVLLNQESVEGMNSVELAQLENVKPGIYTLMLNVNNSILVQKVVKM